MNLSPSVSLTQFWDMCLLAHEQGVLNPSWQSNIVGAQAMDNFLSAIARANGPAHVQMLADWNYAVGIGAGSPKPVRPIEARAA